MHGIAMCDKQWMPSHGLYFCRPECIQEYNGREDVMAERVPLRSRPTSAEVEPVVASHIAPALPLQPGAAPSNVHLNPVPSACTLRPYPPPVLSAARSLHPYPPPLPSACALRPRPYFPPRFLGAGAGAQPATAAGTPSAPRPSIMHMCCLRPVFSSLYTPRPVHPCLQGLPTLPSSATAPIDLHPKACLGSTSVLQSTQARVPACTCVCTMPHTPHTPNTPHTPRR